MSLYLVYVIPGIRYIRFAIKITSLVPEFSEENFYECLDVDAELATNEEPQVFHIAQMEETEKDDGRDVTALETVIPTVAEAHRAAQTLLHFTENQDNGAQILYRICAIFFKLLKTIKLIDLRRQILHHTLERNEYFSKYF